MPTGNLACNLVKRVPTSDILYVEIISEIECAYWVRGGRVPFLTMPLRAAAASVTPLDGPVEVVADSESQDSRREGVELAAEGSALRRWAARRACDLEEFGVLDDPRTDEGHPPPPTHVEVFCSTLVIESVIGAVISMGWLLGGRWPPAASRAMRWFSAMTAMTRDEPSN